jgi:hypothetical protein
MNKAEQHHVDSVSAIGCVICREFEEIITPCEVHHIGEGSGERSNFMVAGLCEKHHRNGSASLHGAGVKRFLRLYKLPTEYHLIELVNKYRAIDELYR